MTKIQLAYFVSIIINFAADFCSRQTSKRRKHPACYAVKIKKFILYLLYTHLYIPLQFFRNRFDRLRPSCTKLDICEGDLE